MSQARSLRLPSELGEAQGRTAYWLVSTWLLVAPLLFFASHGSFFFEYDGNNAVSATYNSAVAIQTASQATLGTAEVWICFALIAMLVASDLSRVIALIRRSKLPLMLALCAACSSIWSQFPATTLHFTIYILVNILLAYYLIAKFEPKQLIALLVITGVIATLSSLVLVAFFPRFGIDNKEGVAAWQGIFPHKNSCAIMLTFFLSVIPFWKTRSATEIGVRFVYTVLALLIIVKTQSRTGWLLLLCFGVFTLVSRLVVRFKRPQRSAIAGAVIIVTLLCALLLLTNLQAILVLLGKDPTLTGRTQIWSAVLVSIKKRPILGYGYHAFWHGLEGESANITASTSWVLNHAQSGYLDVWLDLGLLGLGLVVVSIVQAARNVLVCLQSPAYNPYISWYASLIVMTVVCNLDERTIMYPNFLEWILYIVAYIGISEEALRVKASLRVEDMSSKGLPVLYRRDLPCR